MIRAALTLLLLALPSSLSAFPLAPRSEKLLREAVLDSHNRERARHGVAPVAWSEVLADHAATYAARLARSGVLRHDPTPGRRRVEGENLWAGSRDLFSYRVILSTMTDEGRLFRPGRFPDVSRTGDWSAVGHYSQIIWPTTVAVGCAMASNADHDFLVCRYGPPGNKDGSWVG